MSEAMVIRFSDVNANVECGIYNAEVWAAMDTSSAALRTHFANVARATTPWHSVDGTYGLFSPASICVLRAPTTLRLHHHTAGCSLLLAIGIYMECTLTQGSTPGFATQSQWWNASSHVT